MTNQSGMAHYRLVLNDVMKANVPVGLSMQQLLQMGPTIDPGGDI